MKTKKNDPYSSVDLTLNNSNTTTILIMIFLNHSNLHTF